MPIPNDYISIVAALTEKTNSGDLSWTDENLRIVSAIDDLKFALWSGSDERSDVQFIAFGLSKKPDNKMIDTWFVDESDQDYPTAYALYNSAKRHANGIPVILKNLADRISTLKKAD